MFRHSIKWRFIVPFVVIIVLSTTLLSIFLSNRYTNAYYEDTRSFLVSNAELLAAEISENPSILVQ